jgi:hypothetical protein
LGECGAVHEVSILKRSARRGCRAPSSPAWRGRNGQLAIDLVCEAPEEMKPRRIEIASGAPDDRKRIEAKAA